VQGWRSCVVRSFELPAAVVDPRPGQSYDGEALVVVDTHFLVSSAGDAALRREAGDQTDQESRSAGRRAATSVSAMGITIHASFLAHDDGEPAELLKAG
jgi:hypothetical protein